MPDQTTNLKDDDWRQKVPDDVLRAAIESETDQLFEVIVEVNLPRSTFVPVARGTAHSSTLRVQDVVSPVERNAAMETLRKFLHTYDQDCVVLRSARACVITVSGKRLRAIVDSSNVKRVRSNRELRR